MPDAIEKYLVWTFGFVVSSIAGGIVWLVRRVLTNQKQIELLEADLKNRDRQRQEDRDMVNRVHGEIVEIRRHLMNRTGD